VDAEDERPGEDAVSLDTALLADLDAGVLDGDHAREVGVAAAADPAARAVLDALAATRADLAAVADLPVPAAVADRWRAAITRTAMEQGPAGSPPAPEPTSPDPTTSPGTAVLPGTATPPPGTAVPPDPTPPRSDGGAGTPPPRTGRGHAGATPSCPGSRRPAVRRPAPPRPRGARRAPWRRPAVLAAAALLAVLATALVLGRGPGGETPGVPVTAASLVAQGTSSAGLHDTGPYEEAGRRAACLAAVRPPGVAPAAPLLGGRRVVYEGHPGYLLLLGTARRGTFDVVVVDPGCTARLAAVRVGP
jgi:hypothetical protein